MKSTGSCSTSISLKAAASPIKTDFNGDSLRYFSIGTKSGAKIGTKSGSKTDT